MDFLHNNDDLLRDWNKIKGATKQGKTLLASQGRKILLLLLLINIKRKREAFVYQLIASPNWLDIFCYT